MSYRQRATEIKAWAPAPHKVDPYGPDAPIPENWTPEHVGRRLIEAFRIDRRLPRVPLPVCKGSGFLAKQIQYTPEERAEWEEMPLDVNRMPPTQAEVTWMEKVLDWLRGVENLRYRHAVTLWALRKASASGRSIREIARRLDVTHLTFLERRQRALLSIVSRLIEASTPVF